MKAKGTLGKVGCEWVGSSVGVTGDRLGAGAKLMAGVEVTVFAREGWGPWGENLGTTSQRCTFA